LARAPAEEFQVQALAAPPPRETEGSMTLERLVLDYRSGELVLRCLYRRSLEDAPGPSTKRRQREVSALIRAGLRDALEALEGGAECVGTSGFSTREEILVATTSPDTPKTARQVKGGVA